MSNDQGDEPTPTARPTTTPASATATTASSRTGRRGRAVVAGAVVAALLVGLAMGSAAGRAGGGDDDGSTEASGDGAAAAHGDEDHDAMDGDGLDALLADHHYHPPTDEPLDTDTRRLLAYQLSVVNRMVEQVPTIAAAEAAGYRRAGPFIPGLGTHYIHRDRDQAFTIPSAVGDDAQGEQVRTVLIFDGLEQDSVLVGFMFMALGEEPPDGFAGDHDTWHQHTNICVVVDPQGAIELPFVGDQDNVTEEMCQDRGGRVTPISAHMAHVWSVPGYDSELGRFSEVNPLITCPDGTYHRVPYDELAEPYETTCVA